LAGSDYSSGAAAVADDSGSVGFAVVLLQVVDLATVIVVVLAFLLAAPVLPIAPADCLVVFLAAAVRPVADFFVVVLPTAADFFAVLVVFLAVFPVEDFFVVALPTAAAFLAVIVLLAAVPVVFLAADFSAVIVIRAAAVPARLQARFSFSSSFSFCRLCPSGRCDPARLHFQNQESYQFLLLLQNLLSQQV